jgi:pimeloyl-ACP methyl ester carboxylesterase
MRPVLLVHGIGNDGGTLFEFGAKLERAGHDVKYYRYEKRYFWSYWLESNMRHDGASLLHCDHYEDGMDVIAHSNGQIVVQSAVKQGARFGKVIVFSGAGTSDKFVWPSWSMDECHWFVNTKDKAAWWGSRLPFRHPFGQAARIGYAGVRDNRHKNHKYVWSDLFNNDHSFWFVEWSTKMLKSVGDIRFR